jgi:hypothetical protein
VTPPKHENPIFPAALLAEESIIILPSHKEDNSPEYR